jgi:hypothetical protein
MKTFTVQLVILIARQAHSIVHFICKRCVKDQTAEQMSSPVPFLCAALETMGQQQ